MLNLFDRNDQATTDLYDSLRKVGQDNPTVIIEDDGWLPLGLESPWNYFLNQNFKGQPQYYNQIVVPKLWEIRGSGQSAGIYDYDRLAGRIIYAVPVEKRLVKAVEWFDDFGRRRAMDHYNCYGWRFAQTVYNLKNQPVINTYYTQAGREKIVENLVTGDILLNDDQGHVYNFPSKVAFVLAYLHHRQFNLDQIRYNSLSTPFLVTLALKKPGNDLLFWQEPINKSLPGNMKLILREEATRTQTIAFFEPDGYQKVKAVLPEKTKVSLKQLGYLFCHSRNNQHHHQALVMTNSDQIEQLEALIQALPMLDFKIAAVTEMSEKLQNLIAYANVQLFPNISDKMTQVLWHNCDYYLDINHQNEIKNAVRTAFEHNLLIYAFRNVCHNRTFVAPKHLFEPNEVNTLIQAIRKCLADSTYLDRQLELQRSAAGEVAPVVYRQFLAGD